MEAAAQRIHVSPTMKSAVGNTIFIGPNNQNLYRFLDAKGIN
jgi:hypothetical protein